MTTYSAISQIPLPENTDGLVAQTAFSDYANSLDTLLIPQYSTTAARDAAMASGKIEGQLCTVAGELQYWDGQNWWYQGDARYVIKTADTARTSTITPTADPHLTFAVKSGGFYVVNLWAVPICSITTVNFRFKFGSVGGNVTFTRGSQFGLTPGATVNNNSTVTIGGNSPTTEVSVGAPNVNQNLVMASFVCQATADDTVQLLWAQGTSSATATTLTRRSFIEYRRVM